MRSLQVPLVLTSPPPPFQDLEKCSGMSQLKQYHSQIIRLGFSSRNDTVGQLLKFCSLSPHGDFSYAIKLFHTIPQPDTFIYNTILRASLFHHSPTTCFLLYSHLLQHPLVPNNFTFPPIIRACNFVDHGIEPGKQIHAHVLKFGFGFDGVCSNNLIYMYLEFRALEEAKRVFDGKPDKDAVSLTSLMSGLSRWGLVDEAFQVFQSIPHRNVSASWNAMIAGFVQNNRFQEAFALFDRMRAEKQVGVDKFIATSMLSACSGLGALEQGKWLHSYIHRNGIEIDSKLATAIIDMYCKCGCLEKAFQVFKGLSRKKISSWNCMIGGLAMHGEGEAAIELFRQMETDQIVAPDDITFLNLLSACAHSGLVEDGRYYFNYMTEVYGIQPRTEHFGSMVDLLGRAGMLEEAKKLIHAMPLTPDVSVLGALLGACKNHKNVELGEELGRRVIELEPNNSGRYAILANLYADAGRWEDVAYVRKLMDDRSVKKPPGCSVIELDGVVKEFIAGGSDHPQAREIYAKVDEMLESIKPEGYVPDTNEILYELNEGEGREKPLFYHSEKLAIALGLLRTKPGETIRVSKNLRVCKDCHQASKLISRVYDREISVRDRNRFHRFKEGECSCQDYW